MQWEPIVRLVCKNLGFRWTAVAGSPVLSGLELSNEVSNIPHQSRCRPLTVTSGQKGWACNRGTTYTDRFSLSRGLINLSGAQSRFGGQTSQIPSSSSTKRDAFLKGVKEDILYQMEGAKSFLQLPCVNVSHA